METFKPELDSGEESNSIWRKASKVAKIVALSSMSALSLSGNEKVNKKPINSETIQNEVKPQTSKNLTYSEAGLSYEGASIHRLRDIMEQYSEKLKKNDPDYDPESLRSEITKLQTLIAQKEQEELKGQNIANKS